MCAHGADYVHNGLKYSTFSGNLVTLTGYETAPEGHLIIPATFESEGVTLTVMRIADRAFMDCTGITEVTFPEAASFTTIGQDAFKNCTSLAKVNWPEQGITNLGQASFYNTALEDVTTPLTVGYVGNSVFAGCPNLKRMIFNEGVTNLNYILQNDVDLELVYLPNSLTTFGCYSLARTNKLKKLTLPYQVRKMDISNFHLGMESLRVLNLCAPEVIEYTVQSTHLSHNIKNCDTYVAPGTRDAYLAHEYWKQFFALNRIDDGFNQTKTYNRIFEAVDAASSGFEFTYDLIEGTATVTGGTVGGESLTIPAAVMYDHRIYQVAGIAPDAFKGVSTLTTLMLPHTLTSVGAGAFSGCSALKNIYSAPLEAPELGAGAFSGIAPDCILAVHTGCRESYSSWSGLNARMMIGADPETDQLYYNITTDAATGTATVVKAYYRFFYSGDVEIPDFYCTDGKFFPITVLGAEAFASCSNVTSFKVPESATTWGEKTFYRCLNLASVTFPENLTEIPIYAFYDCKKLDNVTLPRGLKSLKADAFQYCESLSEIVVPEGCLDIGNYAFYLCKSLKKAVIPSGLTAIPNSLFGFCSSLEEVNIPEGLTSVGDYAFARCESLTELSFPDGVESFGQTALASSGIKNFTLPPKVTVIPKELLSGTQLETFTVPANVTLIGDRAFADMPNLKTLIMESPTPPTYGNGNEGEWYSVFYSTQNVAVYVPAGAEQAYEEAPGWKELFATNKDGNYLVKDYESTGFTFEFDEQAGTAALTGVTAANTATELYVPASVTKEGKTYPVTTVAPDSFKDNQTMTSITLPVSITSIGAGAFSGCKALAAMRFQDTVTEIGAGAFSNCEALAEVAFGNALATIGAGAFSNCLALTDLVLPASLTTLGSEAFAGTTNLTGVTCEGTVPPAFGLNAFKGLENCRFRVPYNYDSAYLGADGWREFFANTSNYISSTPEAEATNFTYEFDSSTATAVVSGYKGSESSAVLTDKVMHEGVEYTVTAIGAGAFQSNENLTDLVIPSSVTSIGESAFIYSAISNVNLPESITEIGTAAFCLCPNLTQIQLPSTLTSIPLGAFMASGLSEITIPASVTEIQDYAFSMIPSLTKVAVESATPPTLGTEVFTYDENDPGFEPTNVAACTLLVPKGTLATYQAADQWKDFGTITDQLIVTGIDGIEIATSARAGIWSIDGSYKGSSTENLSPGLYILVRDGKASKIVVR